MVLSLVMVLKVVLYVLPVASLVCILDIVVLYVLNFMVILMDSMSTTLVKQELVIVHAVLMDKWPIKTKLAVKLSHPLAHVNVATTSISTTLPVLLVQRVHFPTVVM